jgi:uncharacterized membrane protein
MGRGAGVLRIVLLAVVLMGAVQVPFGAVGGAGDGGTRGPAPMGGDPVWTDNLDDMSHVYEPETGLVNVEVAGGEVRLATGATAGWVASSIITCPPGYRYDLVLLEADVPGASYVQVSILNASKESSEVGYANETISPHMNVNGTDQSVYDVSPWMYPAIRIQVNLVASGVDRPRLLAWSLFYIGLEEWHDAFLGSGKMSDSRGLNFTGDGLELNLTGGKSGGGTSYDPYPTIALPYGTAVRMYYPNDTHTGYKDYATVGMTTVYGCCFDDLNGDGDIDMVVAGYTTDSKICWGDGTGTYSTSNAFALTTDSPYKVASGDVNGDGWPDLAFGCSGSGTHSSQVFLNHAGTFNAQADIVFTNMEYAQARIGDFNGDGYADILYDRDVYYGGPDGPDTTKDVTLTGTTYVGIKDINQDGYSDVMFGSTSGVNIYLGGASGLSATADVTLAVPYCYYPDAGDINGDGYIDIVAEVYISSGDYKLIIFEGDASGWSTSRVHEIPAHVYLYNSRVVDIDADGYSDILVIDYVGSAYHLRMYMGGTTWPTTPAHSLPAQGYAEIIVAIPKDATGKRVYNGYFVTEPIPLPQGKKWDIVDLTATVPQNTTVKLSVLDGNGREVLDLKDLEARTVDLRSLEPALYRTIKVKVKLSSEFNWTTPVVDRLLVNWLDIGTWRDQFYGAVKVDRMLNLGVVGGELARTTMTGAGPQLLVTALRGASGFDVRPLAYVDGGGSDYAALPPIPFESRGVGAVDAADVNGDGFKDVAFAVHQTGADAYATKSQLFLGSAVGWQVQPDFTFPTVGASDVVLRDLNGDGWADVVFAQEYNGTSYRIDSTLFWGKAGGGWNATPDVQFATNGATGAAAADLDGDGLLDLAFSCYRDPSSTATSSMAFLQGAAGFCGTVPSSLLPTRGATAVAAGDVNGDGRADLAFADSISGGSAEIDSYVYLGKAGGGFEATPKALRTSGARDVELADLDGDGDLDVVFANMRDNVGNYNVDSYVYLNDGTGGFPATPSARLPTTGAVAVAVADLDGTGRRDLVFACQYDGASYNVSSVAYLGGASGWPTTPDIVLPTVGASDVLVGHLIAAGQGGYMSRAITPEDPHNTGAFHTFRYTAALGAGQSGRVQLIDAVTWDVLAETPLRSGTSEWPVKDLFWVKEHPSIRVVVVVSGLDMAGAFNLDDLWLNWTARVYRPPVIVDLGLSSTSLLRMNGGSLWLNVTDDYDPAGILRVTMDHRINGTADPWTTSMLGAAYYSGGSWRAAVFPKASAPVGTYDLRVKVTDSDLMSTGFVVFPNALTVRNNLPAAPAIRIDPASPVTTSTLQASLVRAAVDVESSALSYRYLWSKDGVAQADLTTDTVPSPRTSRGENWSVEVRAFDGDDEGLPGTAWTVIGNAAPFVKRTLPNPELKEDTPDSQWIDLAGAFEDPDGDPLTFTASPTHQNITVTIDPATGKVTLAPKANWNGEESITFIASDGQAQVSQTILVTVTAVNDRPWFTTVDGQPITTDPIALTIKQGQLLVIQVGAADVEGDALAFSVNTSAVQVDEATGEIRFQPGNDVVGTLRFALTMWDATSPNVKVRLNFTVAVENVNDPLNAPSITSPTANHRYKAGQNFSLIGVCTDPDMVYGQVLNYSWYANGTLLGYGASLTVNFTQAGTYIINLTVTDGEFTRGVEVPIVIEAKEVVGPPVTPGGGGGKKGTNYGLIVGIIVVLAVAMLLAFLLVTRRRAASQEAADETEEKREAFKHMAAEVKATADQMEREVAGAKAAAPKPVETTKIVTETRGPDGRVVVSSTGVPEQTLTVQPKETEAASKETEQLFKDMSQAEPVVSEAEQGRMRVDNLKRKYANAIGRLPYGIPSAELKNKDWNELAAMLATGQKRTLPDGREVTSISGVWYYSDPGDSSSFLKEHGAKPKAEAKKPVEAPTMDRETIMAKLDERLAMGEISEETYQNLRRKYEE